MVVPPALVEAWRADRPAPAELRRTYARFVRSQRAKRSAPRIFYWVALGTLLGAGLAQAATLVDLKGWLGKGVQETLQPSRPVTQPAQAPAALSPSLAPSALVQPVEVPEEAVERGAATTRPRTQPTPASSAPEQVVREQWQRAARALREQDAAKAEQALLEIEAGAAAGEREAAQLARAQLLSSHGRHSEATALLRELAAHGQSELVRSKARGLLAAPTKIASPDRSPQPGQDTQ
jgi:hypothetical protein